MAVCWCGRERDAAGHHVGIDLTVATKWESLGQCSINPWGTYSLGTRLDPKDYFKEIKLDEISQQLRTSQIPPAGTGPHGFAIAALETHKPGCALATWHAKTGAGVYCNCGKRIYSTSRICAQHTVSVWWSEYSLAECMQREWNASYSHPFMLKL